MASENRIDSIYDVAAITAEQKKVEALVRASIEQIKAARGQSIDFNVNTKSLSDFTKKSKELETSTASLSKTQIQLASAHKQVQQLIKARMDSEAKLVTLQTDYARETAKNRTEIQKTNNELKAKATLDKAESGSRNRATAQIKILKQERDKLNLTTEAGRKRQEQLNQQIDKYDAFLKKTSSSLEKQRINVGNYQGSAKIIVDALEKTRQKLTLVITEFGEMSAEADKARMEFDALSKITQNEQFLNIAAKVGDANKELRFFMQRLIELETAGLKNSEVYQQVQERLAQLTDQIGDTRQEVKALSSDSRKFDLFAGSVSFAADAFQTFAGAAVLAGASEEDAAEAIKTLVAIQSVANGVKGIANELTTKGTAANKAYNFVLQQGAVLFGRSSTAAQRFGAALNGIIIFAVVGFIIQLVQSLTAFEDKAEDAQKNLEKLNRELERNKKITSDIRESFDFDLKKSLEDLKQSGAAKQQLFQAESDARKKQLDLDRVNVENANEALIREEIRQNQFNLSLARQGVSTISKERADANKATLEALTKNLEETKKTVQTGQRDLILLNEQYQTELFEEQKDNADKAEQERLENEKEAAAKRLQILKANQAAEFGIRKINLEEETTFLESIVDSENRGFDTRLKYYSAYAAGRIKLIQLEAELEIAEGGKTAKELELVELKKNTAIYNLQVELQDKIKKLKDDTFKSTTEESFVDVDLSKIPAELQARIDGFKKIQEEAKKTSETEEELAKRMKDALLGLASELEGLFFDIFTNQIAQQKNAIQDQIDLLDQQKQKDIEVANQTITNAQDKADAIAVIEARAAAKKQQLELKQRQLDQQKARFEKARAVTEIVQSTSIAVVKALAEFPGPAGIALAAVIGALGAVQIARVLAQPIPRYAKGTENHPGGLAIVGDGGKSETLVLPDGSLYRTPSKDTLVNLPAGSQVIPDYQGRPQNVSMIQPVDNTDKLMVGFASVVYAVKRIPQPIIHADRAWTQAHKTGSNYRNYLNRSI